MLECKTVTLRTRPLKHGMLSFYLDYYPGYRDQETMKTIRHEGLNIYIYANPKNERERNFNATMSERRKPSDADALNLSLMTGMISLTGTNSKRIF